MVVSKTKVKHDITKTKTETKNTSKL